MESHSLDVPIAGTRAGAVTQDVSGALSFSDVASIAPYIDPGDWQRRPPNVAMNTAIEGLSIGTWEETL